MKEIWKKIEGFSDYEVSNLGNVRSIERVKKYKSGRTMHLKSRKKKLRHHPLNNFIMTDLVDDKGKRRTVYPHKEVAKAFLENPTPRKRKVVIHIDDDLTNNKAENLRWASYSESILIGFKTGKRDNSNIWEKRRKKYGPQGGTRPMGRPDPLTPEQKRELYKLRTEDNLKLEELAKRFNCSVSHAYNCIKKEEKKQTVNS